MSDRQWMAKVKTMNPDQLLDALVELDDGTSGVGDPYCRDLFGAIIERVRVLRAKRPRSAQLRLAQGAAAARS